ncbi:molybdenum ABC transporter ATP-binding protein [Histidinibacterium aquaticum]|uniref:Molybdenum ABC transporter ATP-binding protein n=1 Tax=Histidinibacterium aquaticum TaxID=2613962 RepID=A0A5J5GSB2_9RHOB|nr:molybdenum ABC transporter ATP-binding protein [Histidinibacterium aquaticum]KAA9010468.1 molybdenum ABC transporter ATP-binding protein [Histidinibacterium aquaticum]
MTLEVRISRRLPGFVLDVDFEVASGITVLFGPSGAGKTSVVNGVAGLSRPDEGRIVSNGRVLLDTKRGIQVAPHRRRIGYVFQEPRLFPHLSVRGNLRYGQRFAGRRGRPGDLDAITEVLGIGPLLDRRPGALSGGEKSRVALGRALLSSPDLILADEPLAALDAARKAEILPLFERLRDDLGVPVLYVSHSAEEVARLATTVVALSRGRVIAQGPALEILGNPSVTPVGPRAAGAVLEARVAAHHADGLTELDAGGLPLFVPGHAGKVGAQTRLRIAAHDVMLSLDPPERISALNVLPGRVETVTEAEGPGVLVRLETPAGPVLSYVTRRSASALGLKEGLGCHAIVKTVTL